MLRIALKLTLFAATDAALAAALKTPKSQRTPKDFRNAAIKSDRKLTHDST
jgi:uncharacterized protein